MDSSVQRVAWEVAVVEVVSWWLGKVCVRSCCRPSDVVAFLVGHRSDRQWP